MCPVSRCPCVLSRVQNGVEMSQCSLAAVARPWGTSPEILGFLGPGIDCAMQIGASEDGTDRPLTPEA